MIHPKEVNQSPGKVSYFCLSIRGTGGLAPNWISGHLSQAFYVPGQMQGRKGASRRNSFKVSSTDWGIIESDFPL